ncbi:MAG: iron-sulfur cluster assembly accessory protein [Verrucomicrobiota bacterium]
MNQATEPIVTLTERAAQQVGQMLGEHRADKGLRIFIDAGGCSGMNYEMELGEAKPGDTASEQHGVHVFVDELGSTYLKGSVIDYSDSLTATGFQIRNPNAKNTCGCGKSFEA